MLTHAGTRLLLLRRAGQCRLQRSKNIRIAERTGNSEHFAKQFVDYRHN